MLFATKTGTLREVIKFAREERMVDGQDPIRVMNGCSEVLLSAQVAIEIEVRAQGRNVLREELHEKHIVLVSAPALDWPALLKMYVSVRSLPVKSDAGKWPVYVFARRFSTEKEALTKFLGKLSERKLNFVVNVVKE